MVARQLFTVLMILYQLWFISNYEKQYILG